MIEIALCLAIIGIGLVAIVGVLPIGLNTQRDTREETVINQDATVLLEAIRNGVRGANDLTNYVYAITNSWTNFTTHVGGVNGYTNGYPSYLTNGANIIGLLSTPEFVDLNYNAANNLLNGGISNHVVAYVRSLSGLAADKPPQNNDIMLGDAFSYHILIVNAAAAMDTPPLWQTLVYNTGDRVTYILNGLPTYWHAVATTTAADVPNSSGLWMRDHYPQQLGANQRELRTTFLWPQRPNGTLGSGRQTFRVTVAGQLSHQYINGVDLYFYQSQSFKPQP